MDELIKELNNATKAYDEGHPIMSDAEFDDKWFKLVALENIFGAQPNSPTQHIVYQVVNELEKVTHEHPMLSLDKTKDIQEAYNYVKSNQGICMLKMDGLTCSLTYENGRLVRAETRGNGLIGENILHNALVVPSIPNYIAYKDRLVVDGEIICDTDTFQNKFADSYKNPRNFAAGSIRLLDANECARRELTFVAWEVIEGFEDVENLSARLWNLITYGFTIVPLAKADEFDDLEQLKNDMIEQANVHHYPIDGLVFKFNDIAYGRSLGSTGHHLKNAIAYKFYDETYPTVLRDISWTMGRTGALTPVAIFDAIDIDGTTVSRANLHNLNIMKELLGVPFAGQAITIFKANQIIPQVYDAEKPDVLPQTGVLAAPAVCPYCGGTTLIENDVLYCKNPNCSGKLINQLDHFCGKKGLEIKGLSVATLEKLIDWGWVRNIYDIFNLSQYRKEWMQKPGFGPASVDKILKNIELASTPSLDRFICAIGIPLIGTNASRDLAKYFKTWENFRNHIEMGNDFYDLDNFGYEMNKALQCFDYTLADAIANDLVDVKPVEDISNGNNLDGITVVITGKLTRYKNRTELANAIAAAGGHVAGSISSKTNYLICNDVNSTSSKHVAAKRLNVPIITEAEFCDTYLTK